MNFKKVSESGLERKYDITVPSNIIQQHVDGWVINKAKNLKLPGFRPGKVPANVVKSRYGDEAMHEAKSQAMNKALNELSDKNNYHFATRAVVDNESFDEKDGFTFSATFEIFPEVQEKDFKKMTFETLSVDFGDKEIDERLSQLARGHATYEEVKTAAKKDQQVMFNLEIKHEGEVIKASDQLKDLHIIVGEDLAVYPQELRDSFEGKKAGETYDVTLTNPKDFWLKEYSEKECTYTVSINKVSDVKSANIDDDLAKKMQCKDLADLKEKMKEQIQKEFERSTNLFKKRKALDTLDKEYTDLELPKKMVEEEFKIIWAELQRELSEKGTESNEKEEKSARKDYDDIAKRRVRLGIVISDLSKKYDLKVTDKMVQDAILREAMNYPGQEKQVVTYFQNNPQAVRNLVAPMLEDLVIDHLFTLGKVNETKISPADLQKKMEEILPSDPQ